VTFRLAEAKPAHPFRGKVTAEKNAARRQRGGAVWEKEKVGRGRSGGGQEKSRLKDFLSNHDVLFSMGDCPKARERRKTSVGDLPGWAQKRDEKETMIRWRSKETFKVQESKTYIVAKAS